MLYIRKNQAFIVAIDSIADMGVGIISRTRFQSKVAYHPKFNYFVHHFQVWKDELAISRSTQEHYTDK